MLGKYLTDKEIEGVLIQDTPDSQIKIRLKYLVDLLYIYDILHM